MEQQVLSSLPAEIAPSGGGTAEIGSISKESELVSFGDFCGSAASYVSLTFG